MHNITLGQYFPADSILHRLDARAKIILALLYIVCSFLCRNAASFAALLLSAFLIILLSRIPIRMVLRSIRPILFIMLFTVLINLFWTGGDRLLFQWRFIRIYEEGLYNAVFMMIRIVTLIIGTTMFVTYTTTPIALTDALESLLTPFKKIGLPVHEFAMMMSIALRFIPTLMEETEKIMAAQKSRGADFASGNLLRRAKALIPILIPLFVSAFRRADELATAMECRCYHGGEGRTRMTVSHYAVKDGVALLCMLLFGGSLLVLNTLDIGYRM